MSDARLPALDVLHEDNHLLAVCKPAGMLTQGDATGDESLFERTREWIRVKYAKPGAVYLGLVHRLDRPASGVVLFAKTSKAAGRLSEQFRARSVEKIYRVVVHGRPDADAGELRHMLVQDRRRRMTRVAGPRSPKDKTVEAVLAYRLLRSADGRSELEVTLGTGRKHQIRVQLADAGCPVVGDFKYGSEQRLYEGRAIALHAARLTVEHPTRRTPVEISAPVPPYWPMGSR